jgi:hypothetical protein
VVKRIVAWTLLVVLLCSGAAVAATDFQGFPIINVSINGKTLVSDVPAINFYGRTMLPVRAVAEALGAEVTWDPATQTVSMKTAQAAGSATSTETATLKTENEKLRGQVANLEKQVTELTQKLAAAEKKNTPTPVPTTGVGTARSTPAPVGTELTFTQSSWKGNIEAKIKLLEVIRGAEAWQRISAANMFNSSAPAGMEYILAKFRFDLLKIDDPSAQYHLSSSDFTAVSSDGRDYDSKFVVTPSPALDAKLYQGSYTEGWLVFAVSQSDSRPVAVIGRDSRGRGGIWFDLKTSASGSTTTTQSTGSTTTTPTTGSSTTGPTSPAQIKTVAEFKSYMNTHYGTVQTAGGPLKLTYDVLENDRTFFAFDKWIQIRFEPSLFFVDLESKVGITPQIRSQSISALKDHARTVYEVAAQAFRGQKIMGNYYDSWYKYPSLQVGFEARQYLTFQNYTVDLFAKNPYTRQR